MYKGKASKLLVLFLSMFAILGIVYMIVLGIDDYIVYPIVFFTASILSIYFSYSLGKFHNFLHNIFHTNKLKTDEPSDFSVTAGKVGGWLLYIMGMIFVFISF